MVILKQKEGEDVVTREKIRHISLRILIALLVSVCVISASAEGEFEGYIVKLSEPLSVMTPFSLDDGICELEYHDNVYVIEDTSVIDALEDEGVVLYVEPNYILEPLGTVPNDEKYLAQWTLDAINYSAIYSGGYNGEGVVVAVIDSGLDISHPDFKDAKISPFSKNFLGNSVNEDAYYRDQAGHGTFVTSQIAAVTDNGEGLAGIASGVELMILRCLAKNTSLKYAYDSAYDSGSGTVSKVSSAIKYAADNGADVINISLGMTSNSATLVEAVNYASSKGVIIVAAVGNSGSTSMYYPANCENVIGVGSVSRSG
ncbi:MAG: S8 family serine peptidase, partial [Clostridia bacterium]|nr:S8 family serine peptidase [Clostridia bacterium]